MPIVVAVIAVAVLSAGGLYYYSKPTDSAPPEPVVTLEVDEAARTEETTDVDMNMGMNAAADDAGANMMSMMYVDGTYSSSATYLTPKRVEHEIAVELTVENDIVTDVIVRYNGEEAKTPMHQNFAGAWEEVVVGQSLDSIELSRVGGASLTSEAFNEAVADIKAEATS